MRDHAQIPRPGSDPLAAADFYRDLLPLSGFAGITDPASFVRLPDDWVIGLADIVSSTQAIEQGHYKTVNTAGAAIISGVSNALGTLDFPFIFGGDGASFAVGPKEAAKASEALAATVAWVGSELGLVLRGAVVPVRTIRDQNLDVRIARFGASDNVTYAMFSGGGLAWAERQLKAGEIALPPAPAGARPDLRGLSCRFQAVPAKHGVILSVLVRPAPHADEARFRDLVRDLLRIIEDGPDAARPIPAFRLALSSLMTSVGIEARLRRRPGWPLFFGLVGRAAHVALSAFLIGTGTRLGGFSPKRYMRELVENSDFRKYDDGLMMTLDCTPSHADRIENRLREAAGAGITHYGLHRQDAATITCVVPSALRSNHVHFVDGAGGGYAMAARALKSRLAS